MILELNAELYPYDNNTLTLSNGSAEVYFALEIESEVRHEYRNGEIVLITGGTPTHNEISSIFNALLRVALKS